MDFGAKISGQMFSDVVEIQLICPIYNLFSGNTAFKRALIMMQDSGGSLPVSVSVLICIFIFELQSESRASMFHFSGYF